MTSRTPSAMAHSAVAWVTLAQPIRDDHVAGERQAPITA